MSSFSKLMAKDATTIIHILNTKGLQAAHRVFKDQTHSETSRAAALAEIAKTGGEIGRQFVAHYPQGEKILQNIQEQERDIF